MNVISLKDYAKQHNISYEAVRQQVVRYAKEMEGHIIRDGRQQFLDDDAVAFLNEKRKKNPVVFYQSAKDEEIERLKQQKGNLLLELASVQKQLIQTQEQNRLLAEENKQIFLLQADNEAVKRQAEEERNRATVAEKEKKEAEIRVSTLEQEKEEISSSLSEAKEQLKNTETVAEINAQERDRERHRAEAAEKEALSLNQQNDALWKRLEEVNKRNFFQRLSDGIVKFFSE